MKKFNFRMEPLLKQRKHLEDEKQKILATAQKKIFQQQDELTGIETTRQTTCQSQIQKTEHEFSVAEMLIYSRYVHKLKKDSMVGGEMLKVLKQDENEKRKELMQAARERKKYEKLKEIQEEKYYKEINEEEKKESDEIALNIFRLNKLK